MIFCVAYRYRKYMSVIERVKYIYRVLGIIYSSRGLYIHIYIYISSAWHHIFAIIPPPPPPIFIEIYRVGNNRRTVNTSKILHISDQLGTENVWETLCWFSVMLRVLVCKNMNRYERHFGSFHRYSSLLMFPIAQSNLPKLAVGAAKTS